MESASACLYLCAVFKSLQKVPSDVLRTTKPKDKSKYFLTRAFTVLGGYTSGGDGGEARMGGGAF